VQVKKSFKKCLTIIHANFSKASEVHMTKKEIEERREMARKQREELRKKLAANPGKG
jgi:hypothetical protein